MVSKTVQDWCLQSTLDIPLLASAKLMVGAFETGALRTGDMNGVREGLNSSEVAKGVPKAPPSTHDGWSWWKLRSAVPFVKHEEYYQGINGIAHLEHPDGEAACFKPPKFSASWWIRAKEDSWNNDMMSFVFSCRGEGCCCWLPGSDKNHN